MSRRAAEIAEKVDLAAVTHATELGPRLVIEVLDNRVDDSAGMQDYFQLRQAWSEGELAAQEQVGDATRFLGGWIQDSPILDLWRTKSSLDLIVSEDWATNLAGWYADRVGKGKVTRCNPILPLRFHFSGVSHLSAHSVDFEGDARLQQEDCVIALRCAQEFLWTQVVSVSPFHIQLAMYVSTWHRKHKRLGCILFLVEAKRLGITDKRRSAWERMFGPVSVNVFDAADRKWQKEPRSIVKGVDMEQFLDDMGVPKRIESLISRPIKYKSRFRRR